MSNITNFPTSRMLRAVLHERNGTTKAIVQTEHGAVVTHSNSSIEALINAAARAENRRSILRDAPETKEASFLAPQIEAQIRHASSVYGNLTIARWLADLSEEYLELAHGD